MSFGKKNQPKSSAGEYADSSLGSRTDLQTDEIPSEKSKFGHRKNTSATSNMPVIRSTFSRSTTALSIQTTSTTASIVLEGLLIRQHRSEKDETKSKNRRWIKMWTALTINSDGTVELHQFKSETPAETLGSSARAALSKSSDAGDFFDHQEISDYSSTTVSNEQKSNLKLSTQNPEVFNVLHSVSTLLPNGHGSRSNVLSLTINTGDTYLYQASTSELIIIWRDTLNYWAARRSKEPLRSGVSSFDYGWGFILQEKRLREREERERKERIDVEGDTISSTTEKVSQISKKTSKESIRSVQSFHTTGSSDAISTRNSISGLSVTSISTSASHIELKKIKIFDWVSPGGIGMVVSHASEENQIISMQRSLEVMREEIEEHASFREPMDKYYISLPKLQKQAQANWIRKNNFLVHEYKKYSTYVSRLQHSINLNKSSKVDDFSETAVSSTSPSTLNTSELQKKEEMNEGPKEELTEGVKRSSLSVNEERQLFNQLAQKNTENPQQSDQPPESFTEIELATQSPMSPTFAVLL
ncbi:hypothetical protein HK096_007070 [Nowakowskiella sp. JEL0078]|nr:hypothetical protein HK096_007070 [Nowakowskiella sp. JEL0078]